MHKAILSGLLSQIGHKTEEGDFLGARQRRFWVHPSSVIGRKKPNWIMAAELVETAKLFARMVARVDPVAAGVRRIEAVTNFLDQEPEGFDPGHH